MQKGDKVVFDIPDNFLTDRYKPIGSEVQSRHSDKANQRIPVKSISIPDLRIPMSLGRNEQFSLLIPRHRRIAGRLIDIFMGMYPQGQGSFNLLTISRMIFSEGMRSIDDLQSVAVYARDRLNPYLFNYALSVALLHRPDTKGLGLPPFVEIFPEKYIDSKVIPKIREEATIVTDGSRMPIIIPKDYTASDLDPEHR